MKINKKVYLGIGILFVIFLIFSTCSGKEEVPEEIVRPVKTFLVDNLGDLSRIYYGIVQGSQRVNLSFRVSGPLIELKVNEGDSLQKDVLIARIDPRDYEIVLAQEKANYKKAVADFERYQLLYEKDAVPLADFDLYLANRDVAKAKLDQAQAAYDDTFLKAPFDGRVGIVYVDNFQEVTRQDKIISLNDLTKIEVVIDIPENVIARTSEGLYLTFSASFESAEGQEFPLKVKEVSTQADPETQTYKVTLIMPQPEDINILPGMTASVNLNVDVDSLPDTVPNVAIPSQAVIAGENESMYVWVLNPDDMSVTQRTVEVGALAGIDEIQILEGLNTGEQVVTSGMKKLRDGMKVSIME